MVPSVVKSVLDHLLPAAERSDGRDGCAARVAGGERRAAARGHERPTTHGEGGVGELEQCMQRFAEGDDSQLASIYDSTAPALHGFLTRLCGDPALAEDLTHETFLRIQRSRTTYRCGSPVLPWMYAIARRLFLDHIRSRKSRRWRIEAARSGQNKAKEAPIVEGGPSADEMLVATRLAARIEKLLATMPEAQSTAFRLLKQEHLSVSEAAAVLGTTGCTVKLRAHRAYETLRAALGRDWDLEGTSASSQSRKAPP
ncbi:MAG TPA: RNA polymerase sigma factor, partial [Labilithrix sp.]|nr:RNA polymerase sigma factor [Labilithrix sp.]